MDKKSLLFEYLLSLRITQKVLQVLAILTNAFWFVTQEAYDQVRAYFIEHTKKCFRKNCRLSFYSWRMARGICSFMVTSIHNIRETIKNSQKLRTKLAKRWLKIQESKEREINLIKKKKSEETKRCSKEEFDWCSKFVKVI